MPLCTPRLPRVCGGAGAHRRAMPGANNPNAPERTTREPWRKPPARAGEKRPTRPSHDRVMTAPRTPQQGHAPRAGTGPSTFPRGER
ncbi:protein of unknown function [Streptomyces murinus]